MISITHEPIHIPTVLSSVQTAGSGAIDVFVGTTRNQSGGKQVLFLEYEAYEPMALREMKGIADQAKSRWEIDEISIVHRVGRVEIEEASVVIAVSAEHREAAFEACRFAIDTLKKDVPIWKKEVFADGEVWVGAPVSFAPEEKDSFQGTVKKK